MPDAMENEIIGAVAYDLISKISPHELPLFKVTRAAYFDNPERVVQRTPTDDTLGFGLEGATTFMTPIILAVSTAAVRYVWEVVSTAVVDAGADTIRTLVRRLFTSTSPELHTVPLPRLSSIDISHIHHLSLKKAQELGLPYSSAHFLADSIVKGLITESAHLR